MGYLKCNVYFEWDTADPSPIVNIYRTDYEETTACPAGYALTGICFSGGSSDCQGPNGD